MWNLGKPVPTFATATTDIAVHNNNAIACRFFVVVVDVDGISKLFRHFCLFEYLLVVTNINLFVTLTIIGIAVISDLYLRNPGARFHIILSVHASSCWLFQHRHIFISLSVTFLTPINLVRNFESRKFIESIHFQYPIWSFYICTCKTSPPCIQKYNWCRCNFF